MTQTFSGDVGQVIQASGNVMQVMFSPSRKLTQGERKKLNSKVAIGAARR